MQFCELCSSIIIDGQCINRRCASRNESISNWIIDGVLYRFRQPVTFVEAQEAVKDRSDVVIKTKPPKR